MFAILTTIRFKREGSIKVNRKKPIIGISASIKTIEKGLLLGRQKIIVGEDYVSVVDYVGGAPIVLPITASDDAISAQIDLLDALIISGGYDVSPSLYGQEPHKKLHETCHKRDSYEIALIEKAVANNIPILGICRGMQLLNVFFGGNLYQDLSCIGESIIQHIQKSDITECTHSVDLIDDTHLKKIFNSNSIRTNSLHHQAINKLAEGFKISAVSKDGIIEGFEKIGHDFLIGVQWHPELMTHREPASLDLFKALINAAGK